MLTSRRCKNASKTWRRNGNTLYEEIYIDKCLLMEENRKQWVSVAKHKVRKD